MAMWVLHFEPRLRQCCLINLIGSIKFVVFIPAIPAGVPPVRPPAHVLCHQLQSPPSNRPLLRLTTSRGSCIDRLERGILKIAGSVS